mgnify:CR=1 FL=1
MHIKRKSLPFFCFSFITISLFLTAALTSCKKNEQKSNSIRNNYNSPITFLPLAVDKIEEPIRQFELIKSSKSGLNFDFQLGDFYARAKEYIFATPMGGIATGDYNGDMLPDIYITRPSGGNKLFKNLGNFNFIDVTSSAKIEDDSIWGTGAGFVDIDGDNDLDIYACGYMTPNKFYINNGDGTFTDKSDELGLNHLGASMNMNFADIDGDGDLDVYLATTTKLPPPGTKFSVDFIKQSDGSEKPVIPDSLAEFWQFIYLPNKKIHKTEAGQADRIFINENGKFVDRTSQCGIKGNYFTLSATWWDYDSDGDPDIYVSNDFTGPDILYKNNGKGVFEDVILSTLPHTPWFSMGSDSADINNDGLIDLFATDMAATSHYREKVMMGNMDDMGWFLEYAKPRQYMRNSLYVNSGTDKMLEAAYLAGIASTDWSWSPRLEDFDCDGKTDLFVTNGVIRDSMNSDLSIFADKSFKGGSPQWRKFWSEQKMRKEKNLAFKNDGNMKFISSGEQWGLDNNGVSLGASTADLDGDGDLDLIVNNADSAPLIYRNNSTKNRISITLIGNKKNTHGVGATVKIKSGNETQIKELNPVKGWLSSNEPILSFGLKDNEKVDELIVNWRSGNIQHFKSIKANQKIIIKEPTTQNNLNIRDTNPIYKRFGDAKITHSESNFDDFKNQPLLPNRQSTKGPTLAWGDFDKDNDTDLFMGGSANNPSRLFKNIDGTFIEFKSNVFLSHTIHEDSDSLWFDADSDNDLDLLVSSGSNEFPKASAAYVDRLYLNDGKGNLTISNGYTPPNTPTSSICTIDINKDGKLDIVVAGSSIPGSYPYSEESYIMINKGDGQFEKHTQDSLKKVRLANDVTSADIDNDGTDEIVFACEWNSIKLYKNINGKLKDITTSSGLEKHKGWWNSLKTFDLDNDGDLDIVATNFGLNTKYKASKDKPELLYFSDFDQSGKYDIVEAKFEGDALVPRRGFSCSKMAMPFLNDKLKTFHNFASSSLTKIYTPSAISSASRYEVNTLEHCVFINENNKFKVTKLPIESQISPSFGFAFDDVDNDGITDIIMAHNFYGPQRETGRMDGGLSLILIGKGNCEYTPLPHKKSGISISGDTRKVFALDINNNGKKELIFAQNNGPLLFYLRDK